MQGYGQVNMRGKISKRLSCKCCTAINKVKIEKYKNINWKLLDDNNDSTNDHPHIVKHFEKQGINIFIQAWHPFNLDVIFDVKTEKWLGYVDDYCLIHDEMYCMKCHENEE